MTYQEAELLFATAKNKNQGKPIARNTRLVCHRDYYAIKLHATEVVKIYRNGVYSLHTEGWRTATTKDRMNQFSPARVRQCKGVWYVNDGVNDYEFYEGAVV
jgi:hypothetical protein